MRQWMWEILECAPYNRRSCFIGGGQWDVPHRLTYLRKLRFCPVEVCLRGERCREGRAHVSAREGFIPSEGAYGVARHSGMSEPSS
jgi:hypothetical protein